MNTTSIRSLADIELELALRPVSDDLSDFANRLSLTAGPEKGYAAFAANNFHVTDIGSRAIGYAEEITRFYALVGSSSKHQVIASFDMLIALSLLNAASTITVALAPPRMPADFAVRRRVHADVITARGNDTKFAQLAGKAFALDDDSGCLGEGLASPAANAQSSQELLEVRPALLGLNQGLSLVAFLKDLAPAGTLVERAALQLDDADRFAEQAEEVDLDQERLERLQLAHQAATLLATADLARATLIASTRHGDRSVRSRLDEQALRLTAPRLRHIVLLASRAADRLIELRRMQRDVARGTVPY